MKIIQYQAKITKAEDGYSVEFPDLPGCFSCGDTLEEAISMGKEAMELYLEEAKDPNWKVPVAKTHKGKNLYWIQPGLEVAIPLTIRELRESRKKTQSQTARDLKMTVQQYQKIEKPKKSNPTSKSLFMVASALGYDIEFKDKNEA